MIEDGFLGGSAGIGRIEKRGDRSLQRERRLHRGTAHTEEETTEQEGCQCILDRMSHDLLNEGLRATVTLPYIALLCVFVQK